MASFDSVGMYFERDSFKHHSDNIDNQGLAAIRW